MWNVALFMRVWREVRNFVWNWWISLQRCCETFRFYQPALCRMCVLECYGLRVCGQKYIIIICDRLQKSCTTDG